jgi:type VI secretion system secreted protein Hcp
VRPRVREWALRRAPRRDGYGGELTPGWAVGQDIFLMVQGQKAGKINGESEDSSHKDEIDVLSWSWGMVSPTDLATGQAARKYSAQALSVTKRVDKASTALMSALTTNETITKAVLTVRKAGKKGMPIEYLKITLEQARLVSHHVHTSPSDPAALLEDLSLAFQKITVDYTPQGPDGQPRGGTNFSADWSPAK